jgi:hypothetical protein
MNDLNPMQIARLQRAYVVLIQCSICWFVWLIGVAVVSITLSQFLFGPKPEKKEAEAPITVILASSATTR